MNRGRIRVLIAAIILFGLPFGFFGYFYSHRVRYEFPKIYGPVKAETRTVDGKQVVDSIYHTIPDFKFVSQTGDLVTKHDVHGKIYIADYFYTTCQGICIDMADQMERVQKFIADKPDVVILSHTVNPETDSLPVIQSYAKMHHADPKKWMILTGDKKELYSLARDGYMISATEGDGGPNDFIHSNKFVLVDSLYRIRGFYDGTDSVSVNKLEHDIELLQLEMKVRKMKKS